MSLLFYIGASFLYIMFMHLVFAIKGQFNVFLMGALFVFGAVVGVVLDSYTVGFVFSIILSLVFW